MPEMKKIKVIIKNPNDACVNYILDRLDLFAKKHNQLSDYVSYLARKHNYLVIFTTVFAVISGVRHAKLVIKCEELEKKIGELKTKMEENDNE